MSSQCKCDNRAFDDFFDLNCHKSHLSLCCLQFLHEYIFFLYNPRLLFIFQIFSYPKITHFFVSNRVHMFTSDLIFFVFVSDMIEKRFVFVPSPLAALDTL